MSSQLPPPRQTPHGRGFTLIEVLVVVAIIGLLVSILLPSLSKARDQGKRASCASNMHQQCIGLSMYSQAHKTTLPCKGNFSYTISETWHEAYDTGPDSIKAPIGMGLLMVKASNIPTELKPGRPLASGSYVGKNWDVLYCPSTIQTYRDDPDTGLNTFWQNPPRYTYGGYNYALPIMIRNGKPNANPLRPQVRMEDPVYPRTAAYCDSRWVKALAIAAGLSTPPEKPDAADSLVRRMAPKGVQVLVMDWFTGGAPTPHWNGVNASYTDGHVTFYQNPQFFKKDQAVSNANSFLVWYYASRRR